MCSTSANLPRFFEQEEELHCCERTAVGRRAERMRTSEKDRLASETMDRWYEFREGLSSERLKSPLQQFQASDPWSQQPTGPFLKSAFSLPFSQPLFVHSSVTPPPVRKISAGSPTWNTSDKVSEHPSQAALNVHTSRRLISIT